MAKPMAKTRSSVSDLNSRRGARKARSGIAAAAQAIAEADAAEERYALGPAPAVTFDGRTGAPIATADPENVDPDDVDDEVDEEDVEQPEDTPDKPQGAAADNDIERVEPPYINAALARDLQDAIMSRKLVGLKQPLSKAILCGETHIESGAEVGCSGYAAVAIVNEKMCGECEKMKSTRLLALCIAHGALYASGEAADPQLRFSLEVSA